MSELPAGWTKCALKDGVTILDNLRVPVNSDERAKRHGDVPYYGATGQVGWINDYLFNEELLLIGEDGAPFFDKTKPIAYIINDKSWVNNHAHVLRALSGITSNSYLKYFLDQFDFHGYVNGTTRLKLTQGSMNTIPVKLAPLNEQRRIVAKLEKLLSRVDAAQARLANIPRILKRFRQSVLAAACSGRLTADWRKEDSDSASENGLPASWICRSIADLEVFIGSGITPRGGKSVYASQGVPFVRSQNVYPSGLRLDDVAFVRREMHEAMPRTHLKRNDILLNITGASIGRSAVVPEDFKEGNVNQHVCIMRLKPDAFPRFISMFLNSPAGQDLIFETQVGVTREGLNYGQLRGFVVPLPPRAEQQEIVRRVEALFKTADALEARYLKANAHVDKLTQSILAKAFRGELVPQDPNDEPASVLLERMRQQKALEATSERRSKT